MTIPVQIAQVSRGKGLEIESHTPDFFSSAYGIFSSREPAHAPESVGVEKVHKPARYYMNPV